MHFSQGWVQFGYRFSNDFVPFALILVALGASRLGRLWPVLVLLVGFSIARQLLGHDLGSDAWLVNASSILDGRMIGRLSDSRSPWGDGRAGAAAGADACSFVIPTLAPSVGSGTRPSSRRSARCWARPTRPATRPT